MQFELKKNHEILYPPHSKTDVIETIEGPVTYLTFCRNEVKRLNMVTPIRKASLKQRGSKVWVEALCYKEANKNKKPGASK